MACSNGGSADPCAADEDGNVMLPNVDAVLACDFDTDVRTVFINRRTSGDYVYPTVDTTGMDEREARIARQEAIDAASDAAAAESEDWLPGGNAAFCKQKLGGHVLEVDWELGTNYVCVVEDAEIPALDAWRAG